MTVQPGCLHVQRRRNLAVCMFNGGAAWLGVRGSVVNQSQLSWMTAVAAAAQGASPRRSLPLGRVAGKPFDRTEARGRDGRWNPKKLDD